MTQKIVLMDVDGSVNPYFESFYLSFATIFVHTLKNEISNSPKEMIREIRQFKKSEKKGLYNLALQMTKTSDRFDFFIRSVLGKVPFDKIPFQKDSALLFKQLLDKRKVILFSDNCQPYVEKVVEHAVGISKHPNLSYYTIEDSYIDGQFYPKNDPNGFPVFAEKMNIPLSECCLVDDNLPILKLAKKVGLEIYPSITHKEFISALKQLTKQKDTLSYSRLLHKSRE